MSSMAYTPTIGIEIHAELDTKTKMFCQSLNDPDETRPNVNICPICLAHPGTLPVINKKAVYYVLRVGEAVGGKLSDYTEFDRKNYFYPDLPKGYQISQYKYPLVTGGSLAGVELTRIHLEEDTAGSKHKGDHSIVDFNRAGIPLMELVTEPVVHSAKEASNFAKELQLLLRYLKVSYANMEKGEMRVEANISISETDKLGTKVEVKNLNSFKAVEQAIDFEIKRQTELLDSGESILQETRGWDENDQETFAQRIKEEANDYRYFPDPDLPKLKISEIKEFSRDEIRKTLPELPWEKRKRYQEEFSLKEEDASMFVQHLVIGPFFDSVLNNLKDKELIRLSANYIATDLTALLHTESKIKIAPASFVALIMMVKNGELSSRGAKDVLKTMFEEGGEPNKIAKQKGLLQQSDKSSLEELAQRVISDNTVAAKEYKKGKEASLQFLVGMAMKESGGSANPKMLQEIFRNLLK